MGIPPILSGLLVGAGDEPATVKHVVAAGSLEHSTTIQLFVVVFLPVRGEPPTLHHLHRVLFLMYMYGTSAADVPVELL
jgi:hypothetical protein